MSEPFSRRLILSCSSKAERWPTSGSAPAPRPARLLFADVDGDVGDAELQRLQVGVDGHELDPGDAGVDHPVDGVDAGPADADDLDHRLVGLAAAGRLVGGSSRP